jgi:hypothetical protein
VGPRAGLDAVEKKKNQCLCRESNPGHPARSPSLRRLSYPNFFLNITLELSIDGMYCDQYILELVSVSHSVGPLSRATLKFDEFIKTTGFRNLILFPSSV